MPRHRGPTRGIFILSSPTWLAVILYLGTRGAPWTDATFILELVDSVLWLLGLVTSVVASALVLKLSTRKEALDPFEAFSAIIGISGLILAVLPFFFPGRH